MTASVTGRPPTRSETAPRLESSISACAAAPPLPSSRRIGPRRAFADRLASFTIYPHAPVVYHRQSGASRLSRWPHRSTGRLQRDEAPVQAVRDHRRRDRREDRPERVQVAVGSGRSTARRPSPSSSRRRWRRSSPLARSRRRRLPEWARPPTRSRRRWFHYLTGIWPGRERVRRGRRRGLLAESPHLDRPAAVWHRHRVRVARAQQLLAGADERIPASRRR